VRAAARETGAAMAALCAYLTTVLPRVRRELRRWRRLAEAIPDPERRRRALAALEEKRSNVEAVAVFATLAPLRQRRAVLRAIVPLQLAIDYRDVLEEASQDLDPDSFLTALDTGWVREVERLVGCGAVAPTLREAVERCAEGQRQTHAAAASGDSVELRRWAEGMEGGSAYRWWELAAGASSSVAAHALIAAAATPGVTAEIATLIDRAYNPSIGAFTVFLDDLVDREQDLAAEEHNYLGYYEGLDEAAERLGVIASRAEALIAGLPRSRRQRAILAGVAAFYLNAQATQSRYGPPVGNLAFPALGPGVRLLGAFVRVRRRWRNRPERAGNPPGP
jgi:tetraprenyl-beta-curcumene synthase